MRHKVLSDVTLRAHFDKTKCKEITVDDGTIITPAARDFLREQNIKLIVSALSGKSEKTKGMTVDVLPLENGKTKYVEYETGKGLNEKPEHMTHLRGNQLIPKDDPRIAFRGKLDSITAAMVKIQIAANDADCRKLSDDIGDLLDYTRSILAAEVKDVPVGRIVFQGMDSDRIRYESQHPREIFGIEHPIPDASIGKICALLNELRTQSREAELAAIRAFGCGTRPDIVEALNRLSSCIYILMLRKISGAYDEPEMNRVPVEVSARHVHLTGEALEALFGAGFHMTHRKDLSQPGQFAANERVKLVSDKGEIDRVSILGPERSHCQVELSKTDAIKLGLKLPVNLSGHYEGAADIMLVGPNGTYLAEGSAVIAMAHIHMTEADAHSYGVVDGEKVGLTLETDRPVTLENVIVRVDSPFKARLAAHIDFDEANASGVSGDVQGTIRKKVGKCRI